MLRAVIALMICAAPVGAQTLPSFDESLGFDIFAAQEDGVLLRNGDHTFFCGVSEDKDDPFLTIGACLPIIGPKAADAARAEVQAAQAAAQAQAMADAVSEEAFLVGLRAMPQFAFRPAISQAIKSMGCVVSLPKEEDALIAKVALVLAQNAGYTADLSSAGIEEIGDLTEPAAEDMVRDGLVVLDRDANTATLVDCS